MIIFSIIFFYFFLFFFLFFLFLFFLTNFSPFGPPGFALLVRSLLQKNMKIILTPSTTKRVTRKMTRSLGTPRNLSLRKILERLLLERSDPVFLFILLKQTNFNRFRLFSFSFFSIFCFFFFFFFFYFLFQSIFSL